MNDFTFALRQLRKSPGFTFIAIITIALGVGATTAIFTVVDATLLEPLPYKQPEQLVTIQADFPGAGAYDVGISQPEWEDLRRSGVFEYVSPTWFDENNLTGSEQPTRVRLLIVAPNFFDLLRVKPQIGRGFDPNDHSAGIIGEVVISDSLWKRGFGRDRQILGKSVRMDTDLYRIVGVMPPGFDAPGRTAEERNVEIYAATSFYGAPMSDHPRRSGRNLPTAVARLKPGLSIAVAQKRIDALVDSLQKQFSEDYPAQNRWRIRLVPLKDKIVGSVRQSLILLFSAVGLVLLISCVNIANLLLARASTRGREIALRQALGASRSRLMRQLLTESLLLSLLGGATGVAILFAVKDFLLRFVPENLPRLNDISISWTVLLFSLGVCIFSGVIFGLAPALQCSRLDLHETLKEGLGSAGSVRRARTRRGLVVIEFALSLVLMIAAALLLRSFWDLVNVRMGFNAQNVVTVRTRMPYPNDPSIDKYATAAQEAPFIRELIRGCTRLPGVEQVALGDPASIPLNQSEHELNLLEGHFYVAFEGQDVDQQKPTLVQRARVSPEYFQVLGLSLLRGRLFTEFDNDTAPQVAVVNEAFAQTYWPNEEAVGQRFKSTRPGSPWITVVGVIANARTESLAQSSVPQLYVNLYQADAKHLAILLRGHFKTAAIADEVRKQVQSLDSTLPVFGGETLVHTVSASLSQRRFSLEIITLFALTALLLASIGVYGVISYLVTERTREIGIRLALGARRRNIMRLILKQGIQLAAAGAAIGLGCALIGSHLMASLLYEVKATDPLSFACVAALFTVVAVLACYVPARRATKIDPMVALRHE